MRILAFLFVVFIISGCKNDEDFTEGIAASYIGIINASDPQLQYDWDTTIAAVSKISNSEIRIDLNIHTGADNYIAKGFDANISESGKLEVPPYNYLSNQGIEFTIEGYGSIRSDSIHLNITDSGLGITATYTYSGSAQ